MFTPANPNFTIIKKGFEGIYISRTCFLDVKQLGVLTYIALYVHYHLTLFRTGWVLMNIHTFSQPKTETH